MLHPDRAGRLTASKHGQALGFGYDSAPKDWRKWHGLEQHDEGALARMAWGTAHEADGISAFESLTGLIVDRYGDDQLWTPYETWSGCTTDGLIDEDALCEIKAPKSPYQEPPEAYYCQVQSQLFITKRQTGYLVCWVPEETRIWKTTADPEYWPMAEPLLKQYLLMLNADKPPKRWKKPAVDLALNWEKIA
jgi:hypothetical protein